MHLASMSIKHLRSVEKTNIDSLGNFNVLIGKNNSGKSNVLAAIEHFFSFMESQTVATNDPSLNRDVDFFNRIDSEPITLCASLRPSLSQIESIFTRIGDEYPQIDQTLPDPSQHGLLEIQIRYTSKPSRIAYISTICSVSTSDEMTSTPQVLLEVSLDSAIEIASRWAKLKEITQDLSILTSFAEQFDMDDWQRLRRASAERASYLGGRLRDRLSSQSHTQLTRLMGATDDPSEGATALQSFIFDLKSALDETNAEHLAKTIRAYAGNTTSIPKYIEYILEQAGKIKVLHLADRRRQIGAEEAARVLELKVRRGGNETLNSIKATVNSLLGVEIDAFRAVPGSQDSVTGRFATPARLRREAELDVDNFLVEANGSGIREALRLVLDLEFEKPQVLLVEEPEVHLHPALEVAMMRHLKTISKETQVFLTTHSTNFLDTGDMRNVYMIRHAVSTTVEQLDLEAAEAEIPKELGIRLSSIFMYDRLVFVEGITDELILRAFAESLSYNISRANVGFVGMGSARNFTHYATNATLSLLSKRNVESIFVLDRDERTEDGIAKLASRLGKEAHLHVLERREIENYLLNEEAIAALLNSRSANSGRDHPPVTPEDVRTSIEDNIENMRELSIAKLVASTLSGIYRTNRKTILDSFREDGLEKSAQTAVADMAEAVQALSARVSDLVAEAEADITSRWDTEKLSIAPGADLLDKVFSSFGFRYRKERDASELAMMIHPDSVPPEINDLIAGICN